MGATIGGVIGGAVGAAAATHSGRAAPWSSRRSRRPPTRRPPAPRSQPPAPRASMRPAMRGGWACAAPSMRSTGLGASISTATRRSTGAGSRLHLRTPPPATRQNPSRISRRGSLTRSRSRRCCGDTNAAARTATGCSRDPKPWPPTNRGDQPTVTRAASAAQVLTLHEVASAPGEPPGNDQLSRLAALTRLHAVAGPLLHRANSHYGNALLSRWPPRRVRLLDLSVGRREPRGAIDAELDLGSLPIASW